MEKDGGEREEQQTVRQRKKGTERVLTMGWKPSSRAAATADTAAGVGDAAAAAAAGDAGDAAAHGVVAGAARGDGVADSGDGTGAAAAAGAAGARWCAASLRLRRAAGGTCALSVAALLHACSSLCCGTPLLRLRLWLCGARARGLLSAAARIAVGWGGGSRFPVSLGCSFARTHAAREKKMGGGGARRQ